MRVCSECCCPVDDESFEEDDGAALTVTLGELCATCAGRAPRGAAKDPSDRRLHLDDGGAYGRDDVKGLMFGW